MGYSPPFVENFKDLKARITQDPETIIQIQWTTDSVCGPCPHNIGNGLCQKQAKIESLDARHTQALGLQENMTLTWSEALARIKTQMSLDKFHAACQGCEWKAYGVCEEALKILRKD